MTGRALSVGVDEAGYAPKLGPLVVTATSLERPAFSQAPAEPDASCPAFSQAPAGGADLYAMLSPAITPSRGSGAGLLVADSKEVYRPGGGLVELERGVLAFLDAARPPGGTLATDLDLVGAVSHVPPDLRCLAWYGGAPSPLPVEADARDIELAAGALVRALGRAGCGRPVIRSRVITARELNSSIARGLNKAEFLVEVVAGLVASGGAPEGAEAIPTTVLVDRLGGRKDYSGLLARAFPGAEVREESLSRTESRYRVGSNCEVTFACRAESRCMTVALSSMVSKYVRELMMRRLNRYFAERIPGLRPTAGYPTDAARFLEDTREFRRARGVPDELFIRAR